MDTPPEIRYSGYHTLWTPIGKSGNTFQFQALYSGGFVGTDSVTVSATWKEVTPPPTPSTVQGAGAGSSAPQPLGTISGWASGFAAGGNLSFTWTFHPRLQFADGHSPIAWTVSADNQGSGYDLGGATIMSAVGTVHLGSAPSSSSREGTVTATEAQVGVGALEINFPITTARSEKQIGFALPDLEISTSGNGANLAEDRLPNGGTASSPHEMNPGSFVIAPTSAAGSEARSKLTLKGKSNSLDGTFTLKAANLANVVIYTSPTGSEKINLPRTWKSAELPSSLYVGAKLFSSGSPVQDGTLTLTYKQTLLAGPADFQLEDSVRVQLMPIDIEPDANMAGVVGDVVKSAKADSTVEHFVTPKKSTDLSHDYVELKAVGVDTATFTQLLEWEGGEAGSTADKRKVKRDATGKTEVRIKVKQGGAVAAQMDVWVVWTTVTATAGTATFTQPATSSEYRITNSATTGWRFVFAIQPQIIITDAERPALSGPSTKPVPGVGKPFPTDPSLGDGDSASLKWDVSRKQSVTISNPDLIPKAYLAQRHSAARLVNQPVALDTPITFPGIDYEGNDDPPIPDEDANPYQVYTGSGLNHQIGELSSYDAPGIGVNNSWGANNRSYALKLNFSEFARLELWDGRRATGQFWYRISEHKLWHHSTSTLFNVPPSKWNDAGSSSGTGAAP